MKRNITKHSLSLTLTLVTDTTQESEAAYSHFGPERAGLITSQGTLGPQHTELLNYCLRSLEILQSKSYTDSDTFSIVMPTQLASHYIIPTEQDGTNV